MIKKMMSKNTIKVSITLFLGVSLLDSCISDEALNAEADIISVQVKNVDILRQPIITNDEVKIYINGWNDVKSIAPTFTLTHGATIEPVSGTVRDFSTDQCYTVTSQDKQWKKEYKVAFITNDIATNYHFENLDWGTVPNTSGNEEKLFHILYEKNDAGQRMTWGSGNAGAKLALLLNNDKDPNHYPTVQDPNGFKGKCVKLQTISTGPFGAGFGMPIAAGNLFMGTFDENQMLKGALATHFGEIFYKMPKMLVGYYKYKAGDVYTDKKNKSVPNKKDDFAIYAVFFERTEKTPYLDGTNSLTSSNIILKAELKKRKESSEWVKFTIPFKAEEGKVVDKDKLAHGKYSLAIIMSSSRDGATFQGAVGSTLYVDELQLFSE